MPSDCGTIALAICLSLPDFGPPVTYRELLIGPARSMAVQYKADGTISSEHIGPVKLALGNTRHYPRIFRREKTAFLVVERDQYTFLATPKTISIVRRWEFGR